VKNLLKLAVATIAALALLTGAAQAEMKKVLIGTEGAYPPFNYIDDNGELVGFDIDIAKALCEAAKFDCEFVLQDWDGIIPALQAKKFDAIIASMSITPERAEKVDFTNKYYNTPGSMAKLKDTEVNLDDLSGMTIGVQRATTHSNYAEKYFPDAEIKQYATAEEAQQDLLSGRVDLIMDDVVVLDEFIKSDAGGDATLVGRTYLDPEIHGVGAGIAVRKGDTELVKAFNDAIKQIRADGTYKKINDKWFDFDVYGD
jgi:lysine-arginine-ornithine-binding protein